MFRRFRDQVLLLMRVPHDPEPPYGAPGSVRVFRAGKNYFNLRLTGWAIAQLVALAAIVFWAAVLIEVEERVHEQRKTRGQSPALTVESFTKSVTDAVAPRSPSAQPEPAQTQLQPPPMKPRHKNITRITGFAGFKQLFVELALLLPDWAFPLIWILKIAGFVIYLAQIPFTYTLRRLDYELRWYIVTDRSLRIRTGLVKLQESTMSFANLQQVEVKQDPIQRLLGLADVHVQSAGGGSGHQGHGKGETHDSLHTGIFHSVDNATEIRDLILERLRQFRQAGLGDPDDHHAQSTAGTPPAPALSADSAATNAETLAAAREMLAEAQALRRLVQS